VFEDQPKRKRKPIDTSKAIPAADLLENLGALEHSSAGYILFYEVGQWPLAFEKLIAVVNLLSDEGWETLSIAPLGETGIMALARRKNTSE
jgi:hypothetical protein